jgi:hypothetical protein
MRMRLNPNTSLFEEMKDCGCQLYCNQHASSNYQLSEEVNISLIIFPGVSGPFLGEYVTRNMVKVCYVKQILFIVFEMRRGIGLLDKCRD